MNEKSKKEITELNDSDLGQVTGGVLQKGTLTYNPTYSSYRYYCSSGEFSTAHCNSADPDPHSACEAAFRDVFVNNKKDCPYWRSVGTGDLVRICGNCFYLVDNSYM